MSPRDPANLNLAQIVHRLLMDPRGWRVDRLREELSIAPRTYRKYRRLLQEEFSPLCGSDDGCGVVEVKEDGHRYLRLGSKGAPPEDAPRFLARVTALSLADLLLDHLDGSGIKEGLDELRREFLASVQDRPFVFRQLLGNLDRLLHHVPDAPKDYSGAEPILRAILHGLFHTKRLRLHYESASGDLDDETIEPLTLAEHRGGLYLFARFLGSKKVYVLAVDRIREIEITGAVFRYPSEADYDPRRMTEGNFGIFTTGEGEPTKVELLFRDEKWLKLYLRERRWHPTQRFQELDDGRLRMTFTVRSMVEVEPWIRSFGDAVRVIRPASQGIGIDG